MVNLLKRSQPTVASADPNDERLEEAAIEEVPLEWARHDIRLKVSSTLERKKRTRPSKYEPFTVDWLESRVGPRDQFYDVGANIGTFSLMAAAMIRAGLGEGRNGAAGGVVAFEPGYSSYARLCENVSLNGLQDLVVPVPLLLGSASGLRALAYRDISPGASRHRLLDPNERAMRKIRSSGAAVQKMLMLSLDDLVATCGLPAPTLMKIDVDGAELEVLNGARSTLRSDSLRSLIIEMDPGLAEGCLELLSDCGLILADRFSTGHARDVHYAVLDRRPVV